MVGRTTTPPHAHMQNFLDCIRSGKETNCPFDVGFRVSIACRMAVDSYRQQRTLRWDAVKEEIV
ncbi:MAG TPA: gfo/Idh/MocA family oxidoreductase, partial [Bryobacteraceae bacterium]|nr:gfo/Idh/MocA family oxidoreductase [Bryobacteraceae bacterium]